MQEQKKYEIRKDKYTKARGGSSKFLSISCTDCGKEALLYQKDGPGRLLRMYLDKILAPDELVAKVKGYGKKTDMIALECPHCNSRLANPMVYDKENRLAFGIIRGKIHSAESNGTFPKEDKKN